MAACLKKIAAVVILATLLLMIFVGPAGIGITLEFASPKVRLLLTVTFALFVAADIYLYFRYNTQDPHR